MVENASIDASRLLIVGLVLCAIGCGGSRAASQTTGEAAGCGCPKFAFTWAGLHDRIGTGLKPSPPDGTADGTFSVAMLPGTGRREVTEIELRGNDYWGTWSTTGHMWLAGAARSLKGGGILNRDDGRVRFSVSEGETFYVFVSNVPGRKHFSPGVAFRLTLIFSDGSTAYGITSVK